MTPEERAEFVQMQKDIEALKGYAWRDALRINALESHKHAVINGETGTPQ